MNIFQYESVAITGFDETRTRKDGDTKFHHVHLSLSKTPSASWAKDFNESWSQNMYMMKRHAQVTGDCIVVTCMMEELDSEFKAELRKVVSEVDDRHNKLAKAEHDQKIQAAKDQQADKQKIAEAAKKFNDD